MRESAVTSLRYEDESEGSLFVAVERITKRDGSRTVELTATRSDDCHDEMVSPNESIGVCTQAWKDVRRILNSEFYMSTGLKTASLDTTLRGRPLTARWRADDSCEPGGDKIKMGTRDAFTTIRWGKDAYTDEEPLRLFSRRAEPKSANDEGTC